MIKASLGSLHPFSLFLSNLPILPVVTWTQVGDEKEVAKLGMEDSPVLGIQFTSNDMLYLFFLLFSKTTQCIQKSCLTSSFYHHNQEYSDYFHARHGTRQNFKVHVFCCMSFELAFPPMHPLFQRSKFQPILLFSPIISPFCLSVW